MQSFEQKDIVVLQQAIEAAWSYLCASGYFVPADLYAREVLAKKVLITAQGNGLKSVSFLANEGIRYAKRFALMRGDKRVPMNENEAPLKIA